MDLRLFLFESHAYTSKMLLHLTSSFHGGAVGIE